MQQMRDVVSNMFYRAMESYIYSKNYHMYHAMIREFGPNIVEKQEKAECNCHKCIV